MKKPRLLTPGPTPIHPQASSAAVLPLPHHRTAAFKQRFATLHGRLQAVFRTRTPVAVLASSGTGAMEAAVVNLFVPGERVLVLAGGKFGLRWGEIASAFGIDAVVVRLEPGASMSPQQAATLMAESGEVTGVLLTASETSTGTAYDIGGIAAALRRERSDVALVVDAITGVGSMPIHTDEWQLDAVVGGSQKALMVPPGLGFVACAERGWERIRRQREQPRFYFDLRRYADSVGDGQTPFTPATSLILQLEAALEAIEAVGGIEALESNAQSLAAATRAAAQALDLELLAASSPSSAVTAIRAPEDGTAPQIVALLRDRCGAQIAGGQGELKPNVFRIGHIGYVDGLELLGLVAVLERVLEEVGHSVQPGRGVAAAAGKLLEHAASMAP